MPLKWIITSGPRYHIELTSDPGTSRRLSSPKTTLETHFALSMSDLYISQNSLGYVVVTQPSNLVTTKVYRVMLHIYPGLAGLSDLCSETQADGAKQPPFQTASCHSRGTARDHGADKVSCPTIKYLVKLKNKK